MKIIKLETDKVKKMRTVDERMMSYNVEYRNYPSGDRKLYIAIRGVRNVNI